MESSGLNGEVAERRKAKNALVRSWLFLLLVPGEGDLKLARDRQASRVL